MRRSTISALLFSSVLITATSAAFGAAITPTVFTQVGTVYNTTALAGFATTGADMDGMLVTAFFAGGTSQTVAWADTGASSGAAIGTGWTLGMAGNTNDTPWVLTNSSTNGLFIVGLRIDARPGDTVFDFTVTPAQSPGSSNGGNIGAWNGSFSPPVDGPLGLSVTGTYSDQLQVAGIFYGDLYLTLDLAFSAVPTIAVNGAGGGLAAGQVLSFASDTDNVATPGDITRVPEPGTLALLGLGLAGLAASRRRK